MKKYCDMCWMLDGFRGMSLQTCKDCGVSVHNECYGIDVDVIGEKNENFTCWACKAVGTTIKVRQRNPLDKSERLQFHVTERPTECMLCSVDDGKKWLHAMHPMYDDTGVGGRQMVLPADGKKPMRLAWGHTLCCFTLNSHMVPKGCVCGVTQEGYYEGMKEDENEDDADDSDTSSINSLLADGLDNRDASIHHFVYSLPKNGKYNDYSKRIEELQDDSKCILCGKNGLFDEKNGVRNYRIPLQCCANEDCELEDFAGCHRDLGTDTCYVAMHVGCAMWMKNDDGEYPSVRRMFFFPGSASDSDPYPETVTNLFCNAHAQDLQDHKKGGTAIKSLRFPYQHLPSERDTVSDAVMRVRSKEKEVLDLKEKQRKRNEKNITMICKDLSVCLRQLSKDAIRKQTPECQSLVRSVLKKWKRFFPMNSLLFDKWFNEALKRALDNVGISAESSTILLNNVSALSAARIFTSELQVAGSEPSAPIAPGDSRKNNKNKTKTSGKLAKPQSEPIVERESKKSMTLKPANSKTQSNLELRREKQKPNKKKTKVLPGNNIIHVPLMSKKTSSKEPEPANSKRSEPNDHSEKPGPKKSAIETACTRKAPAQTSLTSLAVREIRDSRTETSNYQGNGNNIDISRDEKDFYNVIDDNEVVMDNISDNVNSAASVLDFLDFTSRKVLEDLLKEIVTEILAKQKVSSVGDTTTSLEQNTTKEFLTDDYISFEAKENQDKILQILDREFEDHFDDDPHNYVNTLIEQYRVQWQSKLLDVLQSSTSDISVVDFDNMNLIDRFWRIVKVKIDAYNMETSTNTSYRPPMDWSFLLSGCDLDNDSSFINLLQQFDMYAEIPFGTYTENSDV